MHGDSVGRRVARWDAVSRIRPPPRTPGVLVPHAAHGISPAIDRVIRAFAFAGAALVVVLSLVAYVGAERAEHSPSAGHPDAAGEASLEVGATTSAATPPVTKVPPLWWLGTVPFVLLLLAIAILPLVPATAHWWESNLHRLAVALALAFLTLLYVLLVGGPGKVLATVEHAIPEEYVPFIVLLLSLYVVSGGIAILGDFRPTPVVNASFLAIGAIIASVIGTTGASMLLIWPLLRANAARRFRVHTIVFFIFLISNCGGLLLPTGDPPLFLGYLRGVPFLWTLSLWGEWLLCGGALLGLYLLADTILFAREAPEVRAWRPSGRGFRIEGASNFLWLGLVVLTVATIQEGRPVPLLGVTAFPFLRELLMLTWVGLSLVLGPASARRANKFSYVAIIEVACLFVGIFITMQVPLEVLKSTGSELGLSTPAQFFWVTGILSSFLDNAPTYLVFFQTAESLKPAPGPGVLGLSGGAFIREDLLSAVSLGAVFMGAMTYIGNGPNFMVRSIAEQSGVRMPSFFGYMLYSVAVMLPLMVLVVVIFLA